MHRRITDFHGCGRSNSLSNSLMDWPFCSCAMTHGPNWFQHKEIDTLMFYIGGLLSKLSGVFVMDV